MSLDPDHLVAFTAAATLLTITPGLDTALVLRIAVSSGPGRALMAGLGVVLGCFAWGLIVAAGLGALLSASPLVYEALRWIGAAYLLYLGIGLWRAPHGGLESPSPESGATSGAHWLARGFLTNILNPKVGAFYVSFLPQFIPPGANVVGSTVVLTAIHAALGTAWFLVLVLATRPMARMLRSERAIAWLDRITGTVFVAFAVRLATSQR